MYRQVLIHPEDRNLQLILWRDDHSKPLNVYVLNTVTYGTASAPYLAIRSLHYAAERYPEGHEVGKAVITNDFYVDDMITGANDLDSLQIIKGEVTDIWNHSKFSLSKWHSNCPELNLVNQGTKEVRIDNDVTTTLGISWYPSDNTFRFEFRPYKSFSKNTKRSILSVTSTLFDPMGLISPLIIKAKILLQKLWLIKCDWDESVPQDVDMAWNNILADFHNLPKLKIGRCVRMPNSTTIEIHGFTDASIKAYVFCLYFVCKDSHDNVSVNLLASKSRVAPIKTSTLPRLELCGAHLLAIFWNQIKQYFKYTISKVYFWCDSQVTLHWIRSHSSFYFVGNRVAEIQDLCADISWRYVPTDQNPADLVSRGCTVSELCDSNWIHGPTFLRKPNSDWPVHQNMNLSEEIMLLEKRKSALVTNIQEMPYMLKVLHKFSNYLKCLRVLSYVIRLQSKLRPKSTNTSPDEFTYTLHRIVWVLQQSYFPEEFHELEKSGVVTGKFASLALFIENVSGVPLIRVGGVIRIYQNK
ncbi:uncharacterized protein LOC135950691 [Calliphora vicina]|uniref:uncharacterized protein LOC135950691 n=1 Tax=Calliphora vicina TaxID=7373 RepID=UPI00325B311A